jgi:hypothetical protein
MPAARPTLKEVGITYSKLKNFKTHRKPQDYLLLPLLA